MPRLVAVVIWGVGTNARSGWSDWDYWSIARLQYTKDIIGVRYSMNKWDTKKKPLSLKALHKNSLLVLLVRTWETSTKALVRVEGCSIGCATSSTFDLAEALCYILVHFHGC